MREGERGRESCGRVIREEGGVREGKNKAVMIVESMGVVEREIDVERGIERERERVRERERKRERERGRERGRERERERVWERE